MGNGLLAKQKTNPCPSAETCTVMFDNSYFPDLLYNREEIGSRFEDRKK
jgi:hypothetical protein